MSDAERRHTVSESADKITVKAVVKRGTATRDEDKLKLRVKGDDPAAVVRRLDRTLAELEETAAELRAVQPEGEQ
jgi:hypothetical protein